MTTSSQPPNSSKDLFDSITIGSDDTMISVTSAPYITTYSIDPNISTITLTGVGATGAVGSSYITDTITLNQEYSFNWGEAKEWVDAFPDWRRVQDMCKTYPGLEVALRNFQTIYTLVKDDYDNPKDES